MTATNGRKPRPPAHLSARSKALWRAVLNRYILETEPTALELVRLLCEAIDTAEEARVAVAADGAYIAGRFGMKPHPALAVQQAASLRAARLARELNLSGDLGPDHPPSRWGR